MSPIYNISLESLYQLLKTALQSVQKYKRSKRTDNRRNFLLYYISEDLFVWVQQILKYFTQRRNTNRV